MDEAEALAFLAVVNETPELAQLCREMIEPMTFIGPGAAVFQVGALKWLARTSGERMMLVEKLAKRVMTITGLLN